MWTKTMGENTRGNLYWWARAESFLSYPNPVTVDDGDGTSALQFSGNTSRYDWLRIIDGNQSEKPTCELGFVLSLSIMRIVAPRHWSLWICLSHSTLPHEKHCCASADMLLCHTCGLNCRFVAVLLHLRWCSWLGRCATICLLRRNQASSNMGNYCKSILEPVWADFNTQYGIHPYQMGLGDVRRGNAPIMAHTTRDNESCSFEENRTFIQSWLILKPCFDDYGKCP